MVLLADCFYLGVVLLADCFYLGVVLLADCYGPQFPRPLPSSLTFTNDTGGVVSCVVGGEPRPTIAWVGREGTPLPLVPDLYRDMGNGTLQFFRFANL